MRKSLLDLKRCQIRESSEQRQANISDWSKWANKSLAAASLYFVGDESAHAAAEITMHDVPVKTMMLSLPLKNVCASLRGNNNRAAISPCIETRQFRKTD
jgi:hypothetical protein